MTHHVRPLALASLAAIALLLPGAESRGAQEPAPQLDRSRPVEERVEDLLKRLTLEEKVRIVHADGLFTTAAIPRLAIPQRWMSDGPHGVREEMRPGWSSAGRTDDFATWLPVGVALAATWNVELAKAYGQTIGEEARARGKSIMLGPAVNIQRTPLCGRNFEYFGEDPYLSSRMAVPWIRGMQEQDVAACVKHFALNNQEWQRDAIDVHADERTLREIYLPAFEAAVKEAGVLSVMGAYNKFRGQHACQNEYLLNTVLKGEWGFNGLVMSDWNGTHDTRAAALHGLDLEMGTAVPSYDDYFFARPFQRLLETGEIPLSVLDDKVRRNLRVMLATKLLDERPKGSINTKAHQDAARRVAEEAIVLLENQEGLLPLDPGKVRTIAVIGENATRRQSAPGGSSEVKAFYEITPLDGILRRAGREMNVVHARGYRSAKARTAREKAEASALAERAVAAATTADVAIVVCGLNHDFGLDSEGADRPSLDLPGGQAELIRRVVEVNPRTVVVLVSGGPVNMEPWLATVPSVVQAWYAGMASTSPRKGSGWPRRGSSPCWSAPRRATSARRRRSGFRNHSHSAADSDGAAGRRAVDRAISRACARRLGGERRALAAATPARLAG